jgi:hypothetical protein
MKDAREWSPLTPHKEDEQEPFLGAAMPLRASEHRAKRMYFAKIGLGFLVCAGESTSWKNKSVQA